MLISRSILPGRTLRITDEASTDHVYPTSHLQKGWLLFQGEQNLAEEAVGIGLPLLNTASQTIFPSLVELDQPAKDGSSQIIARYTLNLEERMARADTGELKSPILYRLQRALARTIRENPPLRRGLILASSALRRFSGLETTYAPGDFSTRLTVVYTFLDSGELRVEMDTANLPAGLITEVILMNELGAHYFDRYHDSDGSHLVGKQIGNWDVVNAEQATLESLDCSVSFRVHGVPGAKLFRGRELEKGRLAWCGFGYSLPPGIGKFSYTVKFQSLP